MLEEPAVPPPPYCAGPPYSNVPDPSGLRAAPPDTGRALAAAGLVGRCLTPATHSVAAEWDWGAGNGTRNVAPQMRSRPVDLHDLCGAVQVMGGPHPVNAVLP